MAKFVETKNVEAKTLLELGAGCGFTGLYLAKKGLQHAILTDVPSVVPLLTENIALNKVENATGIELFWGDQKHLEKVMELSSNRIDVVVGADVVFDFENFDGMMDLLEQLFLKC